MSLYFSYQNVLFKKQSTVTAIAGEPLNIANI